MNFFVACNALAIGLGGRASDVAQSNLFTESGDNLVQKDGGLILLE